MTLEIEMSTYLTKFLKNPDQLKDNRAMDFNGPVTPEEVLEKLGIPLEEAAIISYNDCRVEADQILDDDGVLRIFPSLIGG